jgi:hypothetical protein
VRRALAVACLVACGDGIPVEDVEDATSGTRMKLEWVYYADGSRQPAPASFYDTELHARCVATDWSDGSVRCAPIADEAKFVDDQCTQARGINFSQLTDPEYFIGYDLFAGFQPTPAHLYRAGPPVGTPAFVYQRSDDGSCLLMGSAPEGVQFHEALAADNSAMVAIEEHELAADGDRIGLVAYATADGLRLPRGLRDRELDKPCTPQLRAEGAVCAPIANDTDVFLDSACSEPGVLAFNGFVPDLIRHVGTDGCAAEYRPGEVVIDTLYRREGAACLRLPADPTFHGVRLGERIAPAPLERAVEDDGVHRLQRVTLGSGSLRWRGQRLVDTATRTECQPVQFGDVTRCIPAAAAPATSLLAPGCGFEVKIAELHAPTCTPVPFAIGNGPEEIEIRAIGEAAPDLFTFIGGACAPYVPGTGAVVHELGPPIPIGTFTPGIIASER